MQRPQGTLSGGGKWSGLLAMGSLSHLSAGWHASSHSALHLGVNFASLSTLGTKNQISNPGL